MQKKKKVNYPAIVCQRRGVESSLQFPVQESVSVFIFILIEEYIMDLNILINNN